MGTARESTDIPQRLLPGYFAEVAGHRSIGYLRFAGAAVDSELVTVAGRVYQFSDDGTVTDSSYVLVDVSASLTAPASAAAFLAAVNGDAYASFSAYLMTNNTVGLVADDDGAQTLSLEEDTTNFIVSGGTFTGGAAGGTEVKIIEGAYTYTGVDNTALTAGDELVIAAMYFAGTTPSLKSVIVRTTAGVVKATTTNIRLEQMSGSLYALTITGVGGLTATDTIEWMAMG